MLGVGKNFVRHIFPAVIKPIRILWNEIIGFIFLAIGVMVSFSTWRNFNGGQAAGNPIILMMGGAFALMLLYFGWSSFRRAKKISRS